MALHPEFPASPYDPLLPDHRWFPADEALRENAYEKLLPPLVAKLRKEIHDWRRSSYEGASTTTKALLTHWFETEHLLENADGTLFPFRYYFAQREAVETAIWLYEVRQARDKFDLLRFDASGSVSHGMFPENWPRYVLKLATGAGKTKVISLLIAWCYFHKLYEADSTLARNFLLVAPNIIVLDRLRADFDGLKIFFNDPILPENGNAGRDWRDDFQLTLHIQDDVRVLRPTGNLFLTNIHRVFLGDMPEPSLDDDDLRDYFFNDAFGPKPVGKTTDSKTDLGEIIREIDELAVFNDEAHHIHDERMAWFKSIEDIHHKMIQREGKLALQIDVTATPKHNNGSIFVQTVSDYPLVEAIHQNVVKHPILPDAASRAKLREHKSVMFHEKYDDYLKLGVEEWRKSRDEHAKLGKKAVLFVMVDDTKNCDDVGAHLEKICPELEGKVLVIHTKNNGDISEACSGKNKKELELLRKQSNEIDSWSSPYPSVRDFVRSHLFEGNAVDLEDPVVLRNLSEPAAGKILFDTFKAAINALTIRDEGTSRIEDRISLKHTRPFRTEARPFVSSDKSIFNRTVGEVQGGGLELDFARFLHDAKDCQAFTKNYLAVGFRLDYVKADGDLSTYTPDFIVRDTGGTVWIIETKGREELDIPQKMNRLKQWCEDATAAEQEEDGMSICYDFLYVDEDGFRKHEPKSLADLAASFTEYKV